MRFSPIAIGQFFLGLFIMLALCAFLVLVAGCRTAGPQIDFRHARDCRVEIHDSATDATQGKTIPIKALADLALSAAQNGDPTAIQEDKSRQDLAAAKAAKTKADKSAAEAAAARQAAIDAAKTEPDKLPTGSTPSTESTASTSQDPPPAGGATGDSE